MFVWDNTTNTSARSQRINIKTLKDKAQTGDLLLFEGNAWYSRLIEFFGYSRYSHIGIIVRDPTYLDPELKGLYLLHSSMSYNTSAVNGNNHHYGVQLVPLDQAIQNYREGKGVMYYRSLECVRDSGFQEKMKNAYKIVKTKPYDLNPCDWIKAEFGLDCGTVQRTNEFWCSSLVAFFYVRLGFLYPSLPWTIIAPRRFSAFENYQLPFQECTVRDEVEVDFTDLPTRKHLRREYFIGK